jgi:RimJ/RimL family protein N-acetyltransferase
VSGPVLATDRLILKPVGLSDFEDLKTVWADERFTWAITGAPLSAEDVWFRLLRDLGHWQATGHGNWAMRMKEGGAYVGSVGVLNYLREIEPPFDAPELGWGVATPFQGRGLAREGLEAALAWADTVLGASRTVCMISPDNAPSLKLADRVGYRPYASAVYKDHEVILLERPGSEAASASYAGH